MKLSSASDTWKFNLDHKKAETQVGDRLIVPRKIIQL